VDERPPLTGAQIGAVARPLAVGSAIDYTTAPSALVGAERREPLDPNPPLFVVGELGYYQVDIPLPKRDGVHVGMVAIDLAGKRSAPSDLTIDLRPPQSRGTPLQKRRRGAGVAMVPRARRTEDRGARPEVNACRPKLRQNVKVAATEMGTA
jgi:hypothetical protein